MAQSPTAAVPAGGRAAVDKVGFVPGFDLKCATETDLGKTVIIARAIDEHASGPVLSASGIRQPVRCRRRIT
jgi:hypothetical protein